MPPVALETIAETPETLLFVVAAYGFLVVTSGHVVRWSFLHAGIDVSVTEAPSSADTGRVIGKSENVLVLSLMLFEAYTALGVIFAAKSLVRRADIGTGDTSYYLTGTLANFTYSVAIGVIVHIVLWFLLQS